VKADIFLSRCDKVKQTGKGTWLARCPGHEDGRPSLSVREVDDGRVLLHCFAGCSVGDVLGAVGLEFDALFPDKPIEHAKAVSRPFPAADVLRALDEEAWVVIVSAIKLRNEGLDAEEHERLFVAAERIQEARRLYLDR
jgi:DNA primase